MAALRRMHLDIDCTAVGVARAMRRANEEAETARRGMLSTGQLPADLTALAQHCHRRQMNGRRTALGVVGGVSQCAGHAQMGAHGSAIEAHAAAELETASSDDDDDGNGEEEEEEPMGRHTSARAVRD